mmetsp:Transcript_153692/g.272569  ORF Transcript_153692/g.272569 Transcript_153692/m.272569 type:complete len:249 (+) Transcript_153692:190-936(+)
MPARIEMHGELCTENSLCKTLRNSSTEKNLQEFKYGELSPTSAAVLPNSCTFGLLSYISSLEHVSKMRLQDAHELACSPRQRGAINHSICPCAHAFRDESDTIKNGHLCQTLIGLTKILQTDHGQFSLLEKLPQLVRIHAAAEMEAANELVCHQIHLHAETGDSEVAHGALRCLPCVQYRPRCSQIPSHEGAAAQCVQGRTDAKGDALRRHAVPKHRTTFKVPLLIRRFACRQCFNIRQVTYGRSSSY